MVENETHERWRTNGDANMNRLRMNKPTNKQTENESMNPQTTTDLQHHEQPATHGEWNPRTIVNHVAEKRNPWRTMMMNDKDLRGEERKICVWEKRDLGGWSKNLEAKMWSFYIHHITSVIKAKIQRRSSQFFSFSIPARFFSSSVVVSMRDFLFTVIKGHICSSACNHNV